jgi:hypothetical protein
MAKDMVCKLCESEPEQEVGIMLISDLTGSGQLPFAIGPRCIEAWLTEMLEVFALPEGIPPSEPSELEEDEVEMTAEPTREPLSLTEQAEAIDAVFAESEDPTEPLEPSGPSPAGSSAPSTGNGRRGAKKLTDPVNIPTA